MKKYIDTITTGLPPYIYLKLEYKFIELPEYKPYEDMLRKYLLNYLKEEK